MRLILSAGALALGLTACTSASDAALPQATHATAAGRTSGKAVSPTSQASRASAAAGVPSAKPVADWCRGTGYQSWQAVTKDLAVLATDSASGAVSATTLATQGRQLASSAAAAASSPPPGVSAIAYKNGMQDLVVSGRDDERDEVSRATALTAEADTYLDNINSDVSVKCQ